MSTPNIERLWNDATRALSMGQVVLAIERLRQILSQEPDFSEAHALLALCLVDMKRLAAAEVEANLAVSLGPISELAHSAMASVCTARRHFAQAEEHYRRVLEMQPEVDDYHRDFGKFLSLIGRAEEAEEELKRALELEPDAPDNLVALGEFRLGVGEVAEADELAEQALSIAPRHLDGLVLIGRIALRNGDVDKAREHAHWALGIDATERAALGLIAAIKGKTNWFLGIWWRYATWVMETGNSRVVLTLLGAFIAYRLARQLLLDAGNDQAAELVSFAWIGICIYSWVGPGMFRRSLEKEIGTVRLRDEF